MSVIEIKNPSSLKIKYDCGMNEDTGKSIVKSKSYSNLRNNADLDKVYEVARGIASLQKYDLLDVIKIDNTSINE